MSSCWKWSLDWLTSSWGESVHAGMLYYCGCFLPVIVLMVAHAAAWSALHRRLLPFVYQLWKVLLDKSVQPLLEEYCCIFVFLSFHCSSLDFSKNEMKSLRRKCLNHYCVKRGLLMHSRLSISDANKRHLNQEWRQVPMQEAKEARKKSFRHSSAEGTNVRLEA